MKMYRWVSLLLLPFLCSCSLLNPQFDQPTVSVKAFRMDYAQAIQPQFIIDLHVVNPNRVPLKLNGLAYDASIDGHKVLAGANGDLPQIAAYGEGDISLTASPDLMGGLALVKDMVQRQRGEFHYVLTIKLDVDGIMLPIRLTEEGTVGIASRRR